MGFADHTSGKPSSRRDDHRVGQLRLLVEQTALSDTTMVNINGRVPRRVTSAPHHDLQTYQSAFPFAQQTQRDAGTDSPGHAIAGGFGRSINE